MNRLAQIIGISVLFLASTMAFAAKKPVMQVDPKDVAVQVQNFPITEPADVMIQLRYVDKKIKYFAFRNQSDKLLKITMFEVANEVKPQEDLSVTVPDVEHIVVEISIYNPDVVNVTKDIQPSKIYRFMRQSDGVFALDSVY